MKNAAATISVKFLFLLLVLFLQNQFLFLLAQTSSGEQSSLAAADSSLVKDREALHLNSAARDSRVPDRRATGGGRHGRGRRRRRHIPISGGGRHHHDRNSGNRTSNFIFSLFSVAFALLVTVSPVTW